MQYHVVSSKAQTPELLLPQKCWQNTGSKFGHEQNQSPAPTGKLVPGLFKEINVLHTFAAILSRISTVFTFCLAILKTYFNITSFS